MLRNLEDRDWVVFARLAQTGPGVDFSKILKSELEYIQEALVYNTDPTAFHQLQGRAQGLKTLIEHLASAQDEMRQRNIAV